MTWDIKELRAGPKFEVVKTGFKRKSAALAWLIDKATQQGMQLYHETDKDNSNCIDVIFLGDQVGQQYAIEPH